MSTVKFLLHMHCGLFFTKGGYMESLVSISVPFLPEEARKGNRNSSAT